MDFKSEIKGENPLITQTTQTNQTNQNIKSTLFGNFYKLNTNKVCINIDNARYLISYIHFHHSMVYE